MSVAQKMAEASCPASCGEFIQGWISGSEKLVSCPIDWFSTVEVRDGAKKPTERPRMRQILEQVVAYFGHPAALSESLSTALESTIPVGKGLASSTADIAATAVATARYLGETLSESTLAALCVNIEPTDSTIFVLPTLFSHLNAQTQFSCQAAPAMDILLLESDTTILTEDYRRHQRESALISHAAVLDDAWLRLQQSCKMQEPRLLGEAATQSAIASQALLPKPMFSQLLALVEEFDLFGVNVAHSGSAVGLMLDTSKHDVGKLLWQINQFAIDVPYPQQHLVKTIAGGVR